MYITQNYTEKRRKTNSINGGEKGGQGKEEGIFRLCLG